MRLSFFSGLLNDFVFAGALWIVLLVLVAGIIYIVAKKPPSTT